MKVCIDVFTKRHAWWMYKYGFKCVNGKNGEYYTTKVESDEAKRIERICRRKRLKYRQYEERWSRSSNYRANFFKAYEPPYRCRYCRKHLKKTDVFVDHIIPVGQSKTNINARMLLYLQNINNVNDVKNLAPSCEKCNKLKGDKMGFWVIRGILGKYTFYWILRYFFILVFIFGVILFILSPDNFLRLVFSFFQ